MAKLRLLDPERSYTFRSYFEMTYDPIEYPLNVSQWLKGNLDYLLRSDHELLIIEAKNDDLSRGFTQLAVELIALAQQQDSSASLFGAVTIGEV